MDPEKRYTRHARLVSKMADRVGLDLIEEMQRGQLDTEDLRTMVHRCQGCTDPVACEKLLEQGKFAENPPSYCRNTETFAAIKR